MPLGSDIIHSVINPIDQLTGAIHIYGGDFFATERSEWDLFTLDEHRSDGEQTRACLSGLMHVSASLRAAGS